MQSPDALLPTQPAPAAVPPQPRRRALPWAVIAGCAVGVVVGLLVGIAIGRADTSASTTTSTTTAPLPSNGGRLKVSSKPADGNVVVDGRFVGVSPFERVDLEPGKHSVVIDVFGYKPYAGTLEVEPHGQLTLSVLLAPIGARDTATTSTAVGAGTATVVPVPASALLPATSTATAREPTRRSEPSAAQAPAPVRPRRDCGAEKSRCRDHCSSASFDCTSRCQGCGSCSTSVGWDECKRQCDTCRSSCEQNTKFCESSCDAQSSNCEASQ